MQWPGGVYNMGFTRQWLDQRNAESEVDGMDWVSTQVAMGDATCADNLTLRDLNIDFESFLHGLEFRPRDADNRSLPLLVREIDVPVYHTGAFQDEQTGALWAGMLDHYTTDTAKFILYNGRHPDGYSPLVLTRWWEFLELFVARRVPRMIPLIRASAGEEFSNAFGVEGLGFEDDRFADFADDDYEGVLAAWKAEPRVRVLFENGAGDPEQPGAPLARYEAEFSTWPPAEAQPMQWFLQDGGALGPAAPPNEAADAYRFDPQGGATTFFGPRGYELTVPLWDIAWTEFAPGDVLSYVTEPLAADTVLAGPGFADLWIRSEVDEASVQVTLTEVRPDGTEFLVQSGWLRLGHRKVNTAAAEPWRIVRSYTKEDFEPVPVGEYLNVQVAIPSVGHAVRAGSQLRVMISAPGRNHGTWEFESPPYDAPPTFLVGRGGAKASSVTMPVVQGVAVEPEYAACPSLRGQPCREYRPVANTPG
jgi:hypothetical protein